MKKYALMMLGLTAALPLYAQDASTPPPDASSQSLPASSSGAAPTEAAPAPAPADNTAAPPADAAATPPADNNAAPADSSAAAAPAPADASTPATTDTSAAPATTEAAPATTEAAPATTEAAPATTEAAPATTEAAPATTEAAPASTEAAPATTEAAPAATEAAPSGEATATVEATPTESAPAEAPAESKPWIFYAGADYGMVKVSLSDISAFYPNKAGGFDYTNKVYLGRIGMRVTDAIGFELHYGRGVKDKDDPTLPYLEQTYGAYVVPTGTLLDMVEFGFPLGFSWAQIKGGGTTVTEDGVSYGMNVEFPFKLVWESLPDIRIGGGGIVYQQNNNSRVYGWHAGLRLDFAI
jgi:hypothetical protein